MEAGFRPGVVLLEKYRVESVLGRGGMGVVLQATHLHLGEQVAIKLLMVETASADVHARFLREAQAVVRLRGEHIARVFDVGVLPDGVPYMVMEYLRGADLSGELAHRRVIDPGTAVDYILQVCEALAEAHAQGIVHRDIKPSNLFLTVRPDGTPLIKVLDFGISKAPAGRSALLTRTDTVIGTPGYMSPEQMQASKDVDARTDIWALGIVLYECLTGRRPFDADSFSATVWRAATEPPPAIEARVPRALQAAVMRCLEKDRTARFPSIAELATALAPFARDRRAAAIVAERAAVMLHPPTPAAAPSLPVPSAPAATTLRGSASASSSPKGFRYSVAGVATLGGVLGVLIAVGVSSSYRSGAERDRSAPPAALAPPVLATSAAQAAAGSAAPAVLPDAPPASGSGGAAALSIAEADPATTGATPPGGRATEPASPLGASAAPDLQAKPTAGAGRDPMQKAEQCAVLEARRDWQQLRACAGELVQLGGKDRAELFRKRAIKEVAGQIAADKVHAALHDGNLREAHRNLRAIATDSVYYATASAAFGAAESQMIGETVRRAQGLAAARDCASVKRLQAQVTATSTTAVVDAVAAVAVKCEATAAPATAAPATASPTTAAAAPAAATPAPPRTVCETLDIDDMMLQAQHQYAAGFSASALHVAIKALACKQDPRMYRFAATYACAAHDAASARSFYPLVPAAFQPAIQQRCQQEGIALP